MSNETGLDWLARNVHKWLEGKREVLVCWPRNVDTLIWSYVLSDTGWITKAKWLARRAELQNKPSWRGAPEWAEWLAQDDDCVWYWHRNKPNGGEKRWVSYGESGVAQRGELLGDWRDTLENRPSDLSEQMVMSRLQEATDNVLAAAPELMTDKYKFDPFVSAEDAATAKQPAPKGSGSPILGMVLADLTNRALEGKEKYGEPLLAHNGRNPLWDAYQEALDLAMYLRQAIEELG